VQRYLARTGGRGHSEYLVVKEERLLYQYQTRSTGQEHERTTVRMERCLVRSLRARGTDWNIDGRLQRTGAVPRARRRGT
jgi:hypothetical protein